MGEYTQELTQAGLADVPRLVRADVPDMCFYERAARC